jgi:hypothetical protein
MIDLEEVVRMVQDDYCDDDVDCFGVMMVSKWSVSRDKAPEKSITSSEYLGQELNVGASSNMQHLAAMTTSRPQSLEACPVIARGRTEYESPGPTTMDKAESHVKFYPNQQSAVHIRSVNANSASDLPNSSDQSAKSSRLSSIGRIPAVVSRRDRERTLSSNSFSRPFARTQPRPSVKPPGSVYSQIREMASPLDPGSQSMSRASTTPENIFNDPESSMHQGLTTGRTSIGVQARDASLAMLSLTDGSERSHQYASSDSGNQSWLNFALQPQEEDIWEDEYNDFMDDVIPSKRFATGSSSGSSFQSSGGLKGDQQAIHLPLPPMVRPPASQIPPQLGIKTKSTVLTVPQQISRFLQPAISPMTPDTDLAFSEGYGDRSCSASTLQTDEQSDAPSTRPAWVQQRYGSIGSGGQDSVDSSQRNRRSTSSSSASLTQVTMTDHATKPAPRVRSPRVPKLINIAQLPLEEATLKGNLRLGALMTSKWLSFGRVLFSPAHNEIQLGDEPRVLVVDGLTSDWAQCIARSYPCAQVYNMTAGIPGAPTSSWPDANESVPSNYRQVPLKSIPQSFPFPRGFFSSVVFRFPIASKEGCHAACIAECRRVLRPGGHLEIVALDLDLKNMGPNTRLAIRGLKTRMQQRDPEVCLKNLSDVLVRLVGNQGFEAIQRCMVGVPAAGRIQRRREVATSSVSSGSIGTLSWRRATEDDVDGTPGFTDVLHGVRANVMTPSNDNDEKITRMMARVGRWWYAACYEKALLPLDRSIWSDATLLRECHKQDTSFRLLICHAQKPFQTRRRTVSV